jgi:hypothetical protein
MDSSRDQAIANLDRLLEGAEALEARLATTKVSYKRARDRLAEGSSVNDALADAQAGDTRQKLTEALDEFEQLRHASRLSLVAAGIEEGMTITAVGRAWGVSRQLASRMAKEVRGER